MTYIPEHLIIAVDGHSSSGKSTFARAIAAELNLTYIDSGAMYRAVTLYALQNGMIDGNRIDEGRLLDSLDRIDISFRYNDQRNRNETVLNGEVIEDRIRELDVSRMVSPVSKLPAVRKKLVALQQQYARHSGVVMDGRDIGTVVFPGADIKIFLVSDAHIRAERRHRELKEKGMDVPLQEVTDNLQDRDRQDSTREISPLKKPDDAIELNNSDMSVEEQMDWFRKLLKEKFG